MWSTSSTTEAKIEELQKFSACDVSDALLKLQKPLLGKQHAGYLPDIDEKVEANLPIGEHGFPPGTHWVDWARPGTVIVIEQPAGQCCAVAWAHATSTIGTGAEAKQGERELLISFEGLTVLPICHEISSFVIRLRVLSLSGSSRRGLGSDAQICCSGRESEGGCYERLLCDL
ncbi:hypothetical protein Egran_00287 [Elaphomyces granulatus]|uniref:Uncharacterized protein n=1 Tax=Elaphomyces granulatus TaxID=519963 RepID=A0A232M6N1_9EURO|nr:hypothetical protein Egran_00287 [Elaphomyces granulatus]